MELHNVYCPWFLSRGFVLSWLEPVLPQLGLMLLVMGFDFLTFLSSKSYPFLNELGDPIVWLAFPAFSLTTLDP